MTEPSNIITGRLEQPAPSLAAILDEVEGFLRRFVVFASDAQSAALALWVAHVYAIDAAPSATYVRITSAVEESGKTTLLECLELLLGERCLNLVSVTPAFVFRMRDKVGPVALLLDEIDNTLKDRKDDGARELLALVNAGYRRSAKVGRTVGREHEGRYFKAFGPAAIAGLGTLAPTTESRCIPVVLERKDRGSGERWLPFLVEDEAAAIATHLAAWASEDTVAALRHVRPAIPHELRDRHAEAWWPLFTIADAAGEMWPTAARIAALSLHADRDAEDTMGLSVLLLAHIRRVIEEHGVDRAPSAQLIRWLVEMAEGPWARWWAADVDRAGHGEDHALDRASASLAGHLKSFRRVDGERLKPHVIKMPDGTTARGYLLDDFADAFPRHLGFPGVTSVTGVTPLASTVTPVTPVTPPEPEKEEPGWRRLQREAGEEPETDEAVALARLQSVLGATITKEGNGMRTSNRDEGIAELDRRIDAENAIQTSQRCPSCGGIGGLEERLAEQVPENVREFHARYHDIPTTWVEIVVPHTEDCDIRSNRDRMRDLITEHGVRLQAQLWGAPQADGSVDLVSILRRAPD